MTRTRESCHSIRVTHKLLSAGHVLESKSRSSLHRSLQATPRVNFALLGSGTSANTAFRYLNCLPFARSIQRNFDTNIAIVGGTGDVWSRFHQDFLMGQSGAFYKSDVAEHRPADTNRFMRVGDYRAEQQQILEQTLHQQPAVFVQGSVSKVKKYGRHDFRITTNEGFEFAANNVLVATGAGPERDQASFLKVRNRPFFQRRPFPEVINGTDFMMEGLSARGGVVLVYGGAPTSAWNTGLASMNHNQVIWIANPGFGGFDSANPAGRNSEIIRQNLENMYWGVPEEISYEGMSNSLDAREGGLVVRIRNLCRPEEKTGKDTELVVSQFVHAIGTDRSSALSFLDPYIYSSLSPIYDVHACFSATRFDVALGLTSEDQDLIVVGPAAYKGLSAKGSSLLWENMARTLPPPAQPYAGIAMGNASIQALTNYNALRNPSRLTANRQQLAEGMRTISHAATESNRLEVADKIIEIRSSKVDVTERELIQPIKDGLGTGGV